MGALIIAEASPLILLLCNKLSPKIQIVICLVLKCKPLLHRKDLRITKFEMAKLATILVETIQVAIRDYQIMAVVTAAILEMAAVAAEVKDLINSKFQHKQTLIYNNYG